MLVHDALFLLINRTLDIILLVSDLILLQTLDLGRHFTYLILKCFLSLLVHSNGRCQVLNVKILLTARFLVIIRLFNVFKFLSEDVVRLERLLFLLPLSFGKVDIARALPFQFFNGHNWDMLGEIRQLFTGIHRGHLIRHHRVVEGQIVRITVLLFVFVVIEEGAAQLFIALLDLLVTIKKFLLNRRKRCTINFTFGTVVLMLAFLL